MIFHKLKYCALALAACLASGPACVRRAPLGLPPLYVNLHSGIGDVALLGESVQSVESRKWRKKEILIGQFPEAERLNLDRGIEFPDIGVRVFFRHGTVALIEVQEPFHGYVAGRESPAFGSKLLAGDSWRDTLIREYGRPSGEGLGGKFGARALFYRWGDVSFNGLGPNQLSLYRHEDIAEYRQRNFGRQIRLFNN